MMWKIPILLSILISVTLANAKPVVVAVVDTGLDLKDSRFSRVLCKTGHKNLTSEKSINDSHGHGTHIAGLIKQYAGKTNYCLLIVKIFDSNGTRNMKVYREGIRYLQQIKPDIVNMSLTGPSFEEEEYILVSQNPSIRFFVSAGNEGIDLRYTKVYPAQLSTTNLNMITVGSKDLNGNRSSFSNFGLSRMTWEFGENVKSTLPDGKEGYMTGTSQATAITTGKYIKSLK